MYDLTGKFNGITFDYLTQKPILSLTLDEFTGAMVDELRACEKLSIKVGKFRQKRSLDANAYAWVLIGKIAEKTSLPKDEIYQNLIRNLGGNYEVVCTQDKALESLCRMWERNGLGWTTESMPSKIEGCTNVLLYYGSSCFDSAQMSRFINLIQEDCRSLGIETKSPEELASLLKGWGNE